ncbi:unnamed protein product, partial [Staurois parvus]
HFLKISNLTPVPAPVRPDVTGTGCRHRPEEMAGGAAGDTSWEAKDKVSAAGTP